jgi:hypothetical protein
MLDTTSAMLYAPHVKDVRHEEVDMAFEEKMAWLNVLVTVVVAGWYASVVAGSLGTVPVDAIAYRGPLILSVGVMVVATVAGSIAITIVAAIGAEIRERGTGSDVDRKDERDRRIEAFGDRVAFYVMNALLVGVLALAMLEFAHFWIANAAFGTLVLAGLVGNAVRVVAYRRGF